MVRTQDGEQIPKAGTDPQGRGINLSRESGQSQTEHENVQGQIRSANLCLPSTPDGVPGGSSPASAIRSPPPSVRPPRTASPQARNLTEVLPRANGCRGRVLNLQERKHLSPAHSATLTIKLGNDMERTAVQVSCPQPPMTSGVTAERRPWMGCQRLGNIGKDKRAPFNDSIHMSCSHSPFQPSRGAQVNEQSQPGSPSCPRLSLGREWGMLGSREGKEKPSCCQ